MLVSFDVVRSRCRCALKKAFLYWLALHELKKTALFLKPKSFSLAENFTNFTQSRFLHTKTSFCTCLSSLSAKICIFTNQKVFFCRKLCELSSKTAFYVQKIFYSHKLSLFPPKITLFCPPPPSRTTLNLLFAKNAAVLLISALNPYAVKPEPHTDSNHCRRYPKNCSFLRCRLPDERRTFQKKSRIDRRFESSPESRGSQTSGVLFGSFCTTQKARKTFPSQGASRFCKPRISTPQPQLRTATIKTF